MLHGWRVLLKAQMSRLRWHCNVWLVKAAVWLLALSGWYNGYWNHWRTLFSYVEDNGFHIMPIHYYSPIPNTRELSNDLWQRNRFPVGFDLRLCAALDWLDVLYQHFGHEYSKFPSKQTDDPHRYYLNNAAFRSGDAEVLYAIVRELKPRRIIEIGSGYSTLIICQAIRANQEDAAGYQCEFVAIEPFPPAVLRPPPTEVTRLVSKSVQQVTLEFFLSLRANDILFIDSTHVARIGSDVVYEYLTILPSLAPGVIVHVHDIFIPAEYPRAWIEHDRFFWNEQYLLEAFLTHNNKFEVLVPMHAIWSLHNERFRTVINSFKQGGSAPSSFWIRRRTSE
jgi:hypothetical protein